MSAFDTAVLSLFSGLGLAALGIAMLARRYSRSALIVSLSGLLALATASTWITSVAPRMDSSQIDKLIAANAEISAELQIMRKRAREPAPKAPDRRNAQIDRLQSELQAERSKLAEANQRAGDLDAKLRATQNMKREAENAVALLEDKLRALPPAPAPPPAPDLPGIRRKLTDGDRPFYATELERQLIPGESGGWYVVRLLRDGRDWNFADRQFFLADATEIKVSAIRLRDDVLRPLSQAGHHWRLFVRGAADPRRVTGPVDRELSYLPRLLDGTYAREPSSKRVTVPVQNDELPNLRADWLRSTVRAVLGAVGTGEIDILENPPQLGHGRTAELVLFVAW